MFSTLDEYPPPVEPVRIYLGVTVTLTASNFDCPLPAISMPCTDGFLGTSPMECTWIKGTGGGEVRLVGKPMQPTLGNPVTDFLYKFPVTIRLVFLPLSESSLKLCGGRCRSEWTTWSTHMAQSVSDRCAHETFFPAGNDALRHG